MIQNKLNIALIGYGKMGKIIGDMASARGHEVVLSTDSKNPLSRQLEKLSNVDAAIEFSAPEIAVDNLKTLAEHRIATVCGTTGWLDRYDEVRRLFVKNKTGFLYASNFSIGVNIFFELNSFLAAIMNRFSEYDVSLYESHHIGKKDAPSGTAVTLAEQIIERSERVSKWHKGRDLQEQSLPVDSHREGDIKGTHEICYRSGIDRISIRHEAFSREGFASGALMAAEWLHGKKGIFNMKDVMRDAIG